MHTSALLIPLAPLFAALLSGCVSTSSCDGFDGGSYMRTIELTPEEYAQWMQGHPSQTSGEQPTTSATSGTSTGEPGGTAMGEVGSGDVGGDAGSGDVGTAGDAGSGDTGSTGAADTTGTDTGADGTSAGTTGAPLTDQEICMMVCAMDSPGGDVESCSIGPLNANGKIPVECTIPAYCEGRRHACVRSHGAAAGHTDDDPAAAWLARAAHDEAASVHAFEALARELADHDAPPELLARLRAAGRDEVRHAARVTALARARGAEPPTPTIAATPIRGLQAIATENAIEGCVRETWAALSAAHQALHADDPALRRIYAEIAADEARHAELAWSLDTWLSGQLGPAARAMVAHARAAAVRELAAWIDGAHDEPALLALGVPAQATARRLVAGLDAALWSRAA